MDTKVIAEKPWAILAGALALALVLGATVFSSPSATAQEDEPTDTEEQAADDRWLEVLGPLIDDGTITTDQAEAIAEHLAESLPGRHGHFLGRGPGLMAFSNAAEIIGIEPSELREAMADGMTLAEVAEENGVDQETLVAGLAGALEERLAEAVENGRITEDRAQEILTNAEEAINAFVTSEIRPRRGFWLTPEDRPAA